MLFRRGIGALRARISAGPSCRRVSVERGKSNGIYVNNQVELSSCEIFGFDYDYTLAEYKGTRIITQITIF